jgi:hypothetical protein
MQHGARAVDVGGMRFRQTATAQTMSNTILKQIQQLYIT